jgi:hypothetical protein
MLNLVMENCSSPVLVTDFVNDVIRNFDNHSLFTLPGTGGAPAGVRGGDVRVAAITYSRTAAVAFPFGSGLENITKGFEKINSNLQTFGTATGGTFIYKALNVATDELLKPSAGAQNEYGFRNYRPDIPVIMVIISDGQTHYEEDDLPLGTRLQKAIAQINGTETIRTVFQVGNNPNGDILKQLATKIDDDALKNKDIARPNDQNELLYTLQCHDQLSGGSTKLSAKLSEFARRS